MNAIVSLLRDPAFLFFAFMFFIVFMGSMTKIAKANAGAPSGGPFSKRKNALNAQDVREIQELHKGFDDLSRRIEALETILLDKIKKG